MSRRENFDRTMNHKAPENIILDLGGCPLSTMAGDSMYTMLDYLGLRYDKPEGNPLPWGQVVRLDERLLEYLDIDTRGVGAVQVPKDSQYRVLSDKEYIDEWGIKRVFTGLYWDIIESPLNGATLQDLKHFDWPDPKSIDEDKLKEEAATAKYLFENTDYVICADLPVYGVFELGCWICGFEDFMIKMAIDPDFVETFFEKVLEYQKIVSEIYYGYLGDYIHYTASGDDFATQNNLFVSKDMFVNSIKPYFKERIAYTKTLTGAAFLHHSCGSVYKIVDELVDCGVDILNPIQPKAKDMEPGKLKEAYGDKIVFHGGFDTQGLLPFGSAEEIEQAVKDIMADFNMDGGYIFACAHNIQEDVPPKNIEILFKAARKYGKRMEQEGPCREKSR